MTHEKIKAALEEIIRREDERTHSKMLEDISVLIIAREALALLDTLPQPTPQNAEADNIRPSVQAAVDKISQSNSGSDYKSEIIGDLTILRRTDTQNAEALEAFDKIVQNGNHDANGVTFGRPHTQFLRHDHIRTIRAALEGVPVDLGARYHVEFDGFTGTVIGSYKRLDGEEGVVMQQDGCKVVHVYRRKWLTAAPKNWLEAQLEEARKDYENWPDWKKKCSRTGEFIRNRNSSKDGGE